MVNICKVYWFDGGNVVRVYFVVMGELMFYLMEWILKDVVSEEEFFVFKVFEYCVVCDVYC